MRRVAASALALLASALPALSGAQTFANGTLAVVTISNGGEVSLLNFARTGTGQTGTNQVALPLFLGTSAWEGALTSDGSNPGRLAVAGLSSSASSAPRRVVQFDAATGGIVHADLGAVGETVHSAQIVGNALYVGGASGAFGGAFNGTATGGSASTTGIGASSYRSIQNLGGTIYASRDNMIVTISGGVETQTGVVLPTTTGGGAGAGTTFPGMAGDFVLADANTLYIAGGRGDLYRSVRSGSGGAFGTPTHLRTPSIAHLAFDGTTLYATTTASSVSQLIAIDPATGSTTVLATAGANRSFRGVEVVPEPGTLLALSLGGLALLRRRK